MMLNGHAMKNEHLAILSLGLVLGSFCLFGLGIALSELSIASEIICVPVCITSNFLAFLSMGTGLFAIQGLFKHKGPIYARVIAIISVFFCVTICLLSTVPFLFV